ncbi:T-complex protein 10 carboxy-terminus containing protein (macronuclear) [Tetrahymena thermophila SB210]|uniref:T-complex protein 10 carboxy-terminus containing protein n=1 Tax=Tetrahymena thermophila (strain SB210) TaxID=312017 RepID=Q23F92_TETTS|nr:T-complex protein 10 carboxy-terminus containing protein [Tetrahymena thermophila SB210]EAR95261.2 T-complex protein 10 carboxy-terminus containing protein [Tetrahymena thermophila SB210]|eukprot:XP_001015506.2 T-complex protein 10 carboxy-terminus containing protein [Tetrahymena thermophila SB210]
MGDQSQSQDRSFQSMMNPNSFNINQGFPQQMMNLDNSMMSAGGGNNQATSQMFDMVNNMFKMMMMNQNGGQFNPNALQSMMSQYTSNMNNSNIGGMNMNSANSQQMGANLFQNNIQPQQYQSQQQLQPQLKQNSNVNLNNTMTRENIDTAFRSMEDRFFNQQNDLQSFYDKLQKSNQSPIGISNNQQNNNSQNPNMLNKKSNNIMNNNPQITGNNSSNLFDLSGFSEQQLQSKSEFVEYDNNFDQSQNFNHFQSSNKQSFVGNQNLRGQAGQNKEEDNDLFNKNYNQKGIIPGNGRSEDVMYNTYNQDRNIGNMYNDRKAVNLNNERPVNQNNIRNSQMPNKFEEKPYNAENINPSSVLGDDNEFLRDSIVNMHQNQALNQYPRNQQNVNKMNNYENEYQQKEKVNQKQFNSNALSDNDQQYLMSNLKVRGNNQNNDDSKFNRGQMENMHPPLSTKSQYQNRPYDINQEEEINQYLPIQSKNSRQNFVDDERPIKGARNQTNPYKDQFEQQDDSFPPQKYTQNKNSQIQNKINNYQELDQPIKSQKNNYFNDERPIQSQKNNQNKHFIDDEDERPIQSSKNQFKNNNQMGNESEHHQQNFNTSRSFNPIEEIPIKSKAGFRNFEDLIEEKMREEGQDDFQDYNDNNGGQAGSRRQTFLKKGSRTFLSNAQKRSKAAQNHIEEIGNQQKGDVIGGSASVTNIQKPKKATSNNFKSASSLSKNEGFGGSNQNNFNEKPVGGSNKLNQIHSTGGLDSLNQISSNVDITDKANGPKEKKKFLQRGQGKGGGIQGFKKEEQANTQSSSQIKDINDKPPQNSSTNQQKKNDKKPQQQKQKKNSDLISLDDEDDYNPRNLKKKRKESNEEYDNKDDLNDDQEENEFGGKKYQPFKYLQDNQDDKDEEENEYAQKINKNSRPPTSLASIQNKAVRKDSEENKNKIHKSEGAYQFDDEEEWGDEDHNRKNNQINNKNKFSKKEDEKKSNKLNIHDSDAGSENNDENEFRDDKSNNNDDEFNDDPDQQYSKVVQKYFNKKGNNQKGSNSNQQKISPGGISLNDLTPEQKRQLIQEFTNEQIEKLDSEVSKVKLENERVKRMRSKYEDLLKSFNKEKEQFAKQKELEIQELEEWKKEEKKKIQNEKRIADRQQKAMQNMPNRKEREEIENLKAMNKKLQEEIKIKDQRNKLTIDRQKKLIDELTQKNQELKDEIKHLENMRLDGGAGSNLNKQNNLSRTSSSKQPQKVPTKSPFKSKPSKTIVDDAYQNDMDEEESLGYSQNNQKNQMKKSNVMGDFQKKKNKSMSSNYDYQYDNNTAKYNNEDDNFKYDYNYDQDDNYGEHNDEDEDAQFENYENYQRDPSVSNASKGSKQGQKNKIHADVSQDYENSYSGKKEEENEDEHLETYEDIINFNPTSHTYSENNKKSKIETKQSINIKQQHNSDVPTSTSNRMNSKSNSISIQNANNSVGSTNTAMSSVSSAHKNDKKKLVQNEKENKQQVVQNSNSTQQKQQIQQKPQKQSVNQQKQYKYDISTLSQCRNISIRQIGDEIQREQFHYDQNIFYQNVIQNLNNPSHPVSENITMDGKIQTFYEDGRQVVQFANGVKRQVFPNGYTLVNFINQDVKQVLPDHTVIYYFADAQTTQTTLTNHINIYNFPSNQIEIHFPQGRKEIIFADGTEKYIYEDGEEKTFFADGSIQTVDVNKVKKIRYKNGKEDVIYPDQNSENVH